MAWAGERPESYGSACASKCVLARASIDRVSGEAGEFRDDSLRFVLDAARLGWWDMDLVTGETVRSAGHDALFGYPELLPSWAYQDFLDHIHPEDRARIDAAYTTALVGGREYAEELRVVWPDGSLHWVFTRGRFVRGPDGTPLRVAGVMGDITERKLWELDAVSRWPRRLRCWPRPVTLSSAAGSTGWC